MLVKQKHNRVWRTYTGGLVLEHWQGNPYPKDSAYPEEWVASVVRARNGNGLEEGVSIACVNNEVLPFDALLHRDPVYYLGRAHVAKYGENMAVLVKLIDALHRLTIQVHPDKQAAKAYFGSEFGKTECWYVLSTREVEGEKPYVLLGFRESVTRAQWESVFARQEIDEMCACLHRHDVVPGDIFLIEGGVPHAIGSGCFLIEIQEPTDFTLRTECTTPQGEKLPEQLIHQGIGIENMLNCFHYEAMDLEQTRSRYLKHPRIVHNEIEFTESILIGPPDTNLFEMRHLVVHSNVHYVKGCRFAIGIVLAGEGIVQGEAVKQADTLFIPAGDASIDIQGALELVWCFPPKADWNW